MMTQYSSASPLGHGAGCQGSCQEQPDGVLIDGRDVPRWAPAPAVQVIKGTPVHPIAWQLQLSQKVMRVPHDAEL